MADQITLGYSAIDRADADYPLEVDIYIHTQFGSDFLDSLELPSSDPVSFLFDTTDFPNRDGYQFELQVSDDEDTTTAMLGPCIIDNEEEVVEEEIEEDEIEQDDNDDDDEGWSYRSSRDTSQGEEFVVDSFFDVFYSIDKSPEYKIARLLDECDALPLDLRDTNGS